MVSRSAFVVAAFVAALTVAAPARAQEKSAPRLVFIGSPGCPDEASFRSAVAVFFEGFDPFDANAADVVRVTFTKIPGGYRGAVQYTPKTGAPWPTEEKTGALCALLFQPVARLASMRALDAPPPGTPEPAPAEPAPPPPPEPVSKPVDPSPPKGPAPWAPPPIPRFSRLEPSRPADKMPYTISLSGFVLMTAGYTADVAPGFQLAAEARSNTEEFDALSFRLGLEFRGLLPGKAYAREPIDPKLPVIPGGLDVSQLSVLLVPCVRWKYLLGCGVADGGVVIAKGMLTAFAPTFRLGPRLGLEVPFAERFAVRAFGEALFATYAVGFAYGMTTSGKDPNATWDYPLVVGFFGVGLSVKFE